MHAYYEMSTTTYVNMLEKNVGEIKRPPKGRVRTS